MAELTQEIPRDSWRHYFDDLSRRLGTTKATIEVDAADLGAQIEAEDMVVTGLSYDDKDDVLVIALDAPGGLRGEAERVIDRPRRVLVAGDLPEEEMAIDVEDGDGRRTIVTMRGASPLPPPR